MHIRVDIAGETELQPFLESSEKLEAEDLERYFRAILEAEALSSLLEAPMAEVSVTFLDHVEMASLNRQYRGKEGSTDILSFPQWDFQNPEDLPFSSEAGWESVPLGDLVISPREVACNAQEENHPFYQELLLVLTHGFLHLLGYDHGDADTEARMFALQERYCVDFFEKYHDTNRSCEKEQGDVMRA